MHLRYFTASFVLGLFVLLLADSSGSIAKADATNPPLARYEGFTEPSRELIVESYLDGVLKTLHVKAGERFKEGDRLVSLDRKMQALAVEVAQLRSISLAEIKIAKARVAEAQVELETQESLASNGSATQRDVRRAKAELDIADAELELAKENGVLAAKQLEIEQEKLSLYTIKAPFNGRVQALARQDGAEEGAALQQNDRIMHIVALDPIIARISLPAKIVRSLEIGQFYRLGVGDHQHAIMGQLDRIAAQADRGSQLIEVVFEIKNPGGKLRSGTRCHLLNSTPADNLIRN